MRGELDDALARLERWDEVRRQLRQEAAGDGDELLDDVVRAVTAVLARRSAGTVTIAVPGPHGTISAELTVRAGAVHTTIPAGPPPGPAADPAPRTSRSAARLAELIRQNPALLDGLRPGEDPTLR
jgi:hypothetical protein